MRFLISVMLCCLLAAAAACSGNGNAASPDLSPEREVETASRMLWGLWDISIDPDTLEATVIPDRTAEFRMNVNTFMNMNPTLLALSNLDGSKLKTTGELTLDVTLTHPVPSKPKLAGFDVHAVFLSNSSATLAYDSALKYPIAGKASVVLNADGWTRWYNKPEFTTPGLFGYTAGRLGNNTNPTARLSAYKLFADGLGSTAEVGSWLSAHQDDRAIFRAGSTNTRQFHLQFPFVGGKPSLKFQYAVVASWAKPSNDDPQPSDFPPEANIAEASHITIDASGSVLFYTATANGGTLGLDVDIFDWQGGADIQSEISRIIIDSSVLEDPYIDNSPSLTQTPGNGYATWSATILADEVSSTDPVTVWIIVESADPTDYDNGVGSDFPDGAALAAFDNASVTVLDEIPGEAPEVHAGILIASGTTQCPNRSADANATFQVIATGDLPLTYHWIVKEYKTGDELPEYDDVPGDGAGNLVIDFTDPYWQTISETLLFTCYVSDGAHPNVPADPLFAYLDCLLFDADFENPDSPDNLWYAFDEAGATSWTLLGGTDHGSNLTGTGALFQNASGGVDQNSSGVIRSPTVTAPEFIFSNVTLEIDHSYSFILNQAGGNVRIINAMETPSVGGEPAPIDSGRPYDATISDATNPLNPYSAFCAANSPSGLFTSYITKQESPPPSQPATLKQLLQNAPYGFAICLQAATGNGVTVADGGWLIDHVRVRGTL